MKFINVPDHEVGITALSSKIISVLNENKRVLWLIPGGSNIPIAVEVLSRIRRVVPAEILHNLSLALTDERYGPVGHPDSNWKQLQDNGIDLTGVTAYSILDGSPLAETVTRYGEAIEKVLKSIDIIIGQFGMGADGHIAGILPHSSAVGETNMPTAGYESTPFTRISLTFPILRKIAVAYVFVSHLTKKAAIDRLHDDTISLADEPAQILKEILEVYVYID